MKVGELIIRLAEFDPDCEILLEGKGEYTSLDWFIIYKPEPVNAVVIYDYPETS